MLRLLGIKGVALPLDSMNQNLRRISKKYRPHTHYSSNLTNDSVSSFQLPPEFETLRLTEIKVRKVEPQPTSKIESKKEIETASSQFNPETTLYSILKEKLFKNTIQKMSKFKQQNQLSSAIYNLKLTKKGTKILKIIETVLTGNKYPSCLNFIADIKSRTSFDTSKFLINLLTFSDHLYFQNNEFTFEQRVGKALNFYFSTKAYQNLHLDDSNSIDTCNTGELLLESIYLATDIQYKITSVENMIGSNASIFELLFNAFKLNDKELIQEVSDNKTAPEDLWVRKAVKHILNVKNSDEGISIPDVFEEDVYRKTFCCLINGDLDEIKAKEICSNLPFIEDTIWFFSFYTQKYNNHSFKSLMNLIIENYTQRGVLQTFHQITVSLFLGRYNDVLNKLIKGKFYWEAVVLLINFSLFFKDFDKTVKQDFYSKILDKFGKMNKLTLVKTMKEKFVDKQIFEEGKLQVSNVLELKDDKVVETYFTKYLETNILQFDNIANKHNEDINAIRAWVKKTITKKNVKLNYLCFLITVYKLHRLCHEENVVEGFKVIRKLDIFPTHKDKEEEINRKLKIFKNKEQNFKDIVGSCGVCLIELYWLKYNELKEDGSSKFIKRDSEKEKTVIKEMKEDLNNIVYFYVRSDDRRYDCILKYLMILESQVI